MADFPVAVITDEFTQDFERICKVTAEMEIPALEVRTMWDKNIVDLDDEQVEEVGRLAKAAGREIVSIASPVYKCTLPGGGDIDHRFEQDAFHAAHSYDDQQRILGRALEVAEKLGASIVRVFSFWRTVEPAKLHARIAEALEAAAEMAGPRGIKIGIENEHACNLATAAEVAPVLRQLDSPHLGLVWDPANGYVSGEEPFPRGYGLLPADRIIHVHAKDGHMSAGGERMLWGRLGEGDLDWKGQLAALVRDGYRGGVSLETHWGGPGGDKFEGSRLCALSLQRLVAEA